MTVKVRSIELKPNYQCNQNCSFCIFMSRKKQPPMTFDEIKDNVDFVTENFDFSIFIISGGEFLIRPDYKEVLNYISSKGVKGIILHTNLTTCSNPDIVEDLSNYPINWIFGSLHGSNSKIHDSQTGVPSSFDKATCGIKNLTDRGFRIKTNTIITSKNVHDLSNILFLLNRLRVEQIGFRLPFAEKEDWERIELLIPDFESFRTEIEKVFDASSKNNINMFINIPPCFYDKPSWNYFFKTSSSSQGKNVFIDKSHQKDSCCISNQFEFYGIEVFNQFVKKGVCSICKKDCIGLPDAYLKKGYLS